VPAKKTKISYAPAATTPSGRQKPKSYVPPMKKPHGNVSELQQYIEDNSGNGKTELELIHEFQEEVCDHDRVRVEISRGPSGRLMKCPKCGDIKKVQ